MPSNIAKAVEDAAEKVRRQAQNRDDTVLVHRKIKSDVSTLARNNLHHPVCADGVAPRTEVEKAQDLLTETHQQLAAIQSERPIETLNDKHVARLRVQVKAEEELPKNDDLLSSADSQSNLSLPPKPPRKSKVSTLQEKRKRTKA